MLHCVECATRVQGRHPEQISDALGAAAVQLGSNILGLAAELKHDMGVSYGKVVRFLHLTFSLGAERSGSARADQRLARGFASTYTDLQQQLRQSEVTHSDETGRRVGGHPAWLWVFSNDQLNLYVVNPHRDHAVVERILGQETTASSSPTAFVPTIPCTTKRVNAPDTYSAFTMQSTGQTATHWGES